MYKINFKSTITALVFMLLMQFAFSSSIWANTLKIFKEDNSVIPITTLNIVFNTGCAIENNNSKGQMAFMLGMLDKGITANNGNILKSKELTELMQFYGMSVSYSIQREYGSITFRYLSRYHQEIMEKGILEGILFKPLFDSDEMSILKHLKIEGINKILENPNQLGWSLFMKTMFADHPFEQDCTGKTKSIESINKKSLVSVHKKYITQAFPIIGIVSDRNKITKDLETKAKNWFEKNIEFEQNQNKIIYKKPEYKGGKVVVYRKNKLDGSRVYVGSLGDSYNSPSQLSYTLMFEALGNHVFEYVRMKQGIGYSVWATFNPTTISSIMLASADPVVDSTKRGIELLIESWLNIEKGWFDKERFDISKKTTLNTIPFKIDTPQKRLWRKIKGQLYNLPEYLVDVSLFKDYILKIKQTDVKKIENHFAKEKMIIVVLAPPQSGDLKIDGFDYVEIKEEDFIRDLK